MDHLAVQWSVLPHMRLGHNCAHAEVEDDYPLRCSY